MIQTLGEEVKFINKQKEDNGISIVMLGLELDRLHKVIDIYA